MRHVAGCYQTGLVQRVRIPASRHDQGWYGERARNGSDEDRCYNFRVLQENLNMRNTLLGESGTANHARFEDACRAHSVPGNTAAADAPDRGDELVLAHAVSHLDSSSLGEIGRARSERAPLPTYDGRSLDRGSTCLPIAVTRTSSTPTRSGRPSSSVASIASADEASERPPVIASLEPRRAHPSRRRSKQQIASLPSIVDIFHLGRPTQSHRREPGDQQRAAGQLGRGVLST